MSAPRTKQCQRGGCVFDVLKRGKNREPIFAKAEDDAPAERVMREAAEHTPMRLVAGAESSMPRNLRKAVIQIDALVANATAAVLFNVE